MDREATEHDMDIRKYVSIEMEESLINLNSSQVGSEKSLIENRHLIPRNPEQL